MNRRRAATRPTLERLEDRLNPSALVVGAAAGSAPTVQILNESGAVIHSFMAYGSNYRGGVNVAQGDLNNDGIADIITAPAKGPGPIKIFDGSTYALIGQLSPFGKSYRGGVNIAVGEVVDGTDDVIAGTATGRAVVKVFDGSSLKQIGRFTPYGKGVSGVNVAVADLNDSTHSSVVTAPAKGGKPLVKAFDAMTGQRVNSFLAYKSSYRGGVQIVAGDFNGNAVPDLATAPNGSGKPVVEVWTSEPNNTMIAKFVASAGGPIDLGTVATAGLEPDRIAVTPKATAKPASAPRVLSLYNDAGQSVGTLGAAIGGGAVRFASVAPTIFKSYTGSKLYAFAYNPTWPGWNSNTAVQLNDSDFFTSAFQGLWGIDPTTSQGRNDLATIASSGANLVRLYNWGPSRSIAGAPNQFTAHLPFLDQAQTLGLKVVVPVSDYFLGNDQYAWNGQNPDSNFSFSSAPQAIQTDLTEFIASITKNGALDPAVQSISIGNELDLGIDNDPGNTAKLQRALWWVVNLHDQLVTTFGTSVPSQFLTIPVSNADQGVPGSGPASDTSWFQIFDHGVSSGAAMPTGAVPGGSFTSDVKGLSSYSWYTTWFYNSVNMFQTGSQLSATLTQYDTGIPSGNTWPQQWPGEKLPVPLLVTELGTTRFNTTQDAQFNSVANNQAQVASTVLKTSTNLMGYTIFENNDEPNKNNYSGAAPISEVLFGASTYNTSSDQNNFRNGTLLYSLHTGTTPWAGGTMPDYVYPVYQLFPIQSTDGTTLLTKLKSIFAEVK